MPHDQLFKELLRTFFREFLELFFPHVAARLRFETVRFLEQETFTDFPDGDIRRADTIAEVETVEGEPEIVLFHIEIESARRGEIRYRMWEYFSLIRLRTRRPVYPVVLFLAPGAGGIVREQYTESLFGEAILTFAFSAVGLPDLQSDDYRNGENVLGVALSALMKPSALGSVLQKWDAIRRIITSGRSESQIVLLTNVIENYLPLSDAQAEEYSRIIQQEATVEVQDMISVYEERGILKGREQGRAEGMAQGVVQGIMRGQRDLLLRQLHSRFGSVPEAIVARVETLDTPEMEALSERLLTANSLDDLGLSIP